MFRIVYVKSLNYSKINFHMLSHDDSSIYPSCYIKLVEHKNGNYYLVARDEELNDLLGVIPTRYAKYFEEAIASNNQMNFVFESYLSRAVASDRKKYYTEEMERISDIMDPESGHGRADEILIDYLAETDCVEMALTFARMEKWYG